ncbi:carboxypeptidase family protein [Luteimonas cucumeris]|uniref:Carboxypeptidase family protein n=1 Tax=Luteimonas cucumeris TaxID=985012 RepID=A0A562L7U1_9GAMM|nr:TonB-dependent receptor [Luteimonas cucumeris]TWI03691.1 carboxypeptidase family protein [Luteimonas cucumeris]
MTRPEQKTIRLNRKLLSGALASCLAVAAGGAWAQSTGAMLRGQVSVESAPAAGATIRAINVSTGYSRTVVAGTTGKYTLAGLPPGTYRVEMTANEGLTTTKTVVLQVGQTATLDLGIGGLPETATGDATTLGTVTVVAAPLVETKTSEVATYVSTKQIESLPQASRNFLSFADTVPGMIFSTGTEGSTSLRSGAQNSNGINVYIDGVGQKNYVLKGGISGQDATRGNPFPQLAIGEYKVITSNYKAEYDQISSAAVTAVTRSGTNDFDGSVFSSFNVTDMRARTPAEIRLDDKVRSKEFEYGASFSGPIIRDALHFFMAYEAKDYRSPRTVSPGENVPPSALPPELRALLGPANAPFNSDLFFGKLSWQAGDDHLVELTTKYRDETELTNIGDRSTALFGTDKSNDELRVDLRWQFSGVDWLNDAHLTYEDASFNPEPITVGVPGIRLVTGVENGNDGRAVLNAGGGSDFQDKGQKGWSLQDDLTFTGVDGHVMKMGVKYKDVELNQFQQQPFNPQYGFDLEESLLTPNVFPYRVQFSAVLPGVRDRPDRNIQSTNKQFGIYFQDDWEVNDKLTLNLGLRWDYEKTPAYLDYRTPNDLVTALRGWSNIQNTDYNIEDYISNGSNRKAFKDAWQPRLGFSYDLFADENHVIFGGAGRSYDRNLFDYIALEQTRTLFPTYRYRFNTPGNPCTVDNATCFDFDPRFFDPNFLIDLAADNPRQGAEVWMINNDLKTPYSDQFSLGMRNALGDWNTSVTLVHVQSKDGIIRSLGNRRPDGSFHEPGRSFGAGPGDGSQFGVPGFGTLILTDNGIETRLNSLLLSLDKPYTPTSGWGTTVAYTFSDAKENRSNAAQNDESFIFDFPNLDGQRMLRSVGVPRHRLVATGIYDAPWGITLSGKLTLTSAITKDAINCFWRNLDIGQDCFFDPATRPGTWGQRQFDVAAEKIWDTGTDIKFRLRMDVLNLFNNTNYLNFNTFRGEDGVANPLFGTRADTDDAILLPTRMVKVTMGASW